MEKAKDNRERIANIKFQLDSGIISYEKAKEMAEPVILDINRTAVELAKKYGVKARKVSFISLMR